ncbi:SRPBCC family protein [Streptomyces sp. NBC_00243]|uniref:SRPBCC family protein n=1 Tax=Streptomyces sp. NBC_00243 TaxID=2975688 RepID=UPI002DDA816A|nr:SRPBCC family protein [Streptomyces sp. NBC_00243]WRZ17581.1 SRPBCC family protein [Streptomyces sp. NBC_00243]
MSVESPAPTGSYLTLEDGRPAVRFTRTYDHPVDRLWRFVTDPDELVHWFPSHAEIDLRPGGTITFSGDPNMPESTGRVIAVDAPRHLSFEWGGDELHFDLEALDEKRTRFTLTNVLEAENTAARNGAGWEVCLGALDAHARGEEHAGPHAGSAAPWQEIYRRYIEAGIPSGAPVSGHG